MHYGQIISVIALIFGQVCTRALVQVQGREFTHHLIHSQLRSRTTLAMTQFSCFSVSYLSDICIYIYLCLGLTHSYHGINRFYGRLPLRGMHKAVFRNRKCDDYFNHCRMHLSNLIDWFTWKGRKGVPS